MPKTRAGKDRKETQNQPTTSWATVYLPHGWYKGFYAFLILSLLMGSLILGLTTGWAAESGRRIVVFQPGTAVPTQEAIIAASGSTLLQRLSLLNAMVIRLPAGQEEAALTVLQSHLEVQAIEYDASISAQSLQDGIQGLITPALSGPDGYTWNLLQIGLDQVNPAIQGTGVSIAVLDTGIDVAHPDLVHAVVGGYNARAGEVELDYIDRNGHGTHIAGIIHAIAPRATLYAVRVLDDLGGGYLSDVVNGLSWIYQHPDIRVVNMSLGFYEGSPLLYQVIQLLHNAGVTLVASVGNYNCSSPTTSEGGDSEGATGEGAAGEGEASGTDCTALEQVKYPASYPETIGVGATDIFGQVTPYSLPGLAVDIVAPGGIREGDRVLSTHLTLEGGYGWGSGTSQATGHVTGVIALLLQTNPVLTPDDLRMILQDTALDLGINPEKQGAGLIDTAFAIQQAPLVCFGQYATIIGTEGNDNLKGTSSNDVIVGLGGDDVIDGGGGDDLICGGDGNDVLKGGGGNDFLDGGLGFDTIKGDKGKDTCTNGEISTQCEL